MLSNIKWKLGMKVKFNWDGLNSSGTICKLRLEHGNVIVCLDKQDSSIGWIMGRYDIDPSLYDTYNGMNGWCVHISALKPIKTKLGNEL